ncbi:hypothetical protein J7U46_05160 [Pelomonas sp. V22]|uniref:hypothetical protein n=1 Tax=Pelomonas sp. V22 TaxID=2822139 RepID=UPI0024A7C249|nr:hypothetical protein [Pelomonas sp. V22]MDI4632425.1 hypothetical protein [Pelomonas sp. V22]
MTPNDWLKRLESLLAHYPQYGIGPDLAGMAMIDLWGLWQFLERLAQEAGHGPAP